MTLDKITILTMPLIALTKAGVETSQGADSIMQRILTLVATIGGGILAIFLIYLIVKDSIDYVKNKQGSVWSIVSKAIFLLLCIGLIYIALDWKNIAKTSKEIGEGGLKVVETIGKEIFPGQ